MKVAILGCGSLGGVMAARIAGDPRVDLTVIERDPRIAEAIAKDGLVLRQGNKTWSRSVNLVESPGERLFDALILATKAGSLVQAATALKANLTAGASVITIQNGLVALARTCTKQVWPVHLARPRKWPLRVRNVCRKVFHGWRRRLGSAVVTGSSNGDYLGLGEVYTATTALASPTLEPQPLDSCKAAILEVAAFVLGRFLAVSTPEC